MHVNRNTYPAEPKRGLVDFPRLSGGLNLRELNYRLSADQSPQMENLWWQDGVLQSRDGQRLLSDGQERGEGFACAPELYQNAAFFHIGTGLYWADMTDAEARKKRWDELDFTLRVLSGGVPANRGSFFRYDGSLFYKNRGGFFRIEYDEGNQEEPFSAVSMTDSTAAYTPVTVINASPGSGAGTLYQPENRLSPRKEVHYNAERGVTVYSLPVKGIDCVVRVSVDGDELAEGTDYTVDAAEGTVSFRAAPPVTEPPVNNTVEIVYSKENPEVMRALMDCPYAAVAGNGNNLCVLLAGAGSQPNAVFWNSNDALAMNAGYFPVEYYNLCGDASDGITGFGQQYGELILFKERSVGKLLFGVETVEGRDSISFTWQNINAHIGCDLPWSIQLVENNLVFCNRKRGVHILRSSSAALENNVSCVSENVNGVSRGLLADLRAADCVSSTDDSRRYWLCAGEHVYLWDYGISTPERPSWFYFTGIRGVCYFVDGANQLYHLDRAGGVSCFERSFRDYPTDGQPRSGSAIPKRYTFPTQFFGGYDRLKDVLYLMIVVRSDTDTEITLYYETDYERREDLTKIRSYAWHLAPRDLSHRCLAIRGFGHVEKRKPGCRHIRHFSMTLENAAAGQDLAVVSAQIYYRFQGKER